MARPGTVLPDWLADALRQGCNGCDLEFDPSAFRLAWPVDHGDRDMIPVPVERLALAHGHFFRRPTLFQSDSGELVRRGDGGIHRGREHRDLQVLECEGSAGGDTTPCLVLSRLLSGSRQG